MRSASIVCALIILLCFTSIAGTEPELAPVHPHESASYTIEERFGFENALQVLVRIRSCLQSFRELTLAVKGKIPAERLGKIGNTDWETQHLGFHNGPGAIEGALRRQDLLIKQLCYELILEQQKNGTASEKDIPAAKMAYEEAEKAFQEFYSEFHIAD